ncbi:hypothetical protein CCMA1212_003610 [Trichoderma ghanense]|uniref:Uncharacterized protein n=1 Tax=Trichoderma ghanense TaxID=65468 RepID=A0ABY2H8G8_9HYPO
MELAHAQQNPPPRRAPPKRRPHGPRKHRQADGIEAAQHRPHDELRMLGPCADQRDQRLAQAREEHRPNKRPRHGAGEGEVVVRRGQPGVDVARGRAVGEDVVRGLQVEGFFDFGVGGAEEVQEGDCEEEDVCALCALSVLQDASTISI